MMLWRPLALAIWILSVSSPAGAAETIQGAHVRVRWLAPSAFGETPDHSGILFETEPGWHVYWRNSGDSGAPPKFERSAEGAEIGEILWPRPHRLVVGPITNFGYEGAIAYPFRVIPKPGFRNLKIETRLEWLVCKEECIPGFGVLSLQRPVAGQRAKWSPTEQEKLQEFLRAVPGAATDSPLKVSAHVEWGTFVVSVEGAVAEAPEVFPLDGSRFPAAAPVVEHHSAGRWRYLWAGLPVSDLQSSAKFVVSADGRSWEFDVTPASGAAAPTPASGAGALWILLISAFVGGLLLNLMPCVLPVISIKALSVIRLGLDRHERWREASLYTTGVLIALLALAALFVVLRASGEAIGWGFQLQSPVVVLALMHVFFLMALSLLDVLTLGEGVMAWAGRQKSGGSALGSGLLSVLIATPCTGPFLGTALGASATLPAPHVGMIFAALGLGLAAPYVVLVLHPKTQLILPRPGPWMVRLKQFLAFPLFATVLWLMWVFQQQQGGDSWLMAAAALWWVSLGIWGLQSHRRWLRGLSAAAIALGVLGSPYLVAKAPVVSGPGGGASAGIPWEMYSPERVVQARSEGRPVFVDFTAAWCVTCQVNKKTVIDTTRTRELFERHRVVALTADWTRQDSTVTAGLQLFGRNSVPLNVFYPANGSSPQVLPLILTQSVIEELFKPD